MRFLKPVAVFVIAVITSQASVIASDEIEIRPSQQADTSRDAATPSVKVQAVSTTKSQPRFQQQAPDHNGFDQFRREPDLGAGSSPSHGYKHFPASLNMFGKWYRPRASTLTKNQRCAPDEFRPRGFGHLFARPCDPFRMEYTPYVVKEQRSEYGPAYLSRACDPRCEKCDSCR